MNNLLLEVDLIEPANPPDPVGDRDRADKTLKTVLQKKWKYAGTQNLPFVISIEGGDQSDIDLLKKGGFEVTQKN